MNNLKRVTAALLAATMIFTSMGNGIISYVNATETEEAEIPTEASETEESEISAEESEETLASEAGMEMKQPESEKIKERSEQDDDASKEDASKERTEGTNAEEEIKEDEDTKAEEAYLDLEEETVEDENLMEEDIELLKEELSKSHEKKDYIILMEDENTANEIQEEYREVKKEDVTEAKEESAGDVQVVVSEMTGETAAEILDEDGVLCVEEDIEIEGLSVDKEDLEIDEGTAVESPNDTWNLEMLHADHLETEPSERGQEGECVQVAVLDSGVEGMSDVNTAGSVNFVDEEGTVPLYMEDMTGHGTSVARIIQRIAPNSDIYSIKVLDENNKAPLSRIIRGIYWCIEFDMDIINMSFGSSTESIALKKAIWEAGQAGILMIAAAGNGGADEGINYPAAYDEVVAVGAVDEVAQRREESAVGEELELVAPGENIVSEGVFGLDVMESGTSMAAPHVTGIAAVLWGKDGEKPAGFIRYLLSESARCLGEESEYGNGMPDISYALEHYGEYEASYEDEGTDAPENTGGRGVL